MKKLLLTVLTLLTLFNTITATAVNKMKMTTEINQTNTNIKLPVVPKPVGDYLLYQMSGNKIYISQVALNGSEMVGPGIVKNAEDIPRGQKAARQTMLNILAIVQQAVGNLDQIKRIVRLDGYIASAPGFTDQAKVMNGASEVAVEVLGRRGLHARSAVGSIALPLNSAVEISAVIELKKIEME